MISIIVPVYNAAKYLPQCLDSILQQTYTDFELLLIDDGSVDQSGEICDSYSALDSRCKVVHQENKGTAAARNKGLELASGEYVAFVDNDDWIHPLYLEYLHKAINEGDFLLSMVLYQKTERQSIGVMDVGYSTDIVYSNSLRTMLYSIEDSDIPYGFIWAKLYRRELLDNIRFKDVIGEDIEFSFNVNNKLESAIVVTQSMYNWFQHPESQFHNRSSDKLNSSIDCYYLILNEIPKSELQIRACCLKRLWLVMLSTRYMVDKYDIHCSAKCDVVKNAESVRKSTIAEFVHNKYIPLTYRVALPAFYYMPSLYNLFRWAMEKYTILLTVSRTRKMSQGDGDGCGW